jgi:ribosome-binding factor A
MESKRQQKVARQIQKDLSDIFQKEGRTWFDNAFITVTVVRMSPDLGVARVYLSFLIAKNKGLLLEQIQDRSKSIRQLLGQKIRHQLRIVPEIHFYLDDTAEYAAKMDTLFAKITIPPAKGEESGE